MDTLAHLQASFGGRLVITAPEAAQLLFGWNAKTTYNRLGDGRFPLRTARLGRAQVVRLEEVVRYLDTVLPLSDGADARSPAGPAAPPPPARAGRPTNRDKAAAKAAGYRSVADWRRATGQGAA